MKFDLGPPDGAVHTLRLQLDKRDNIKDDVTDANHAAEVQFKFKFCVIAAVPSSSPAPPPARGRAVGIAGPGLCVHADLSVRRFVRSGAYSTPADGASAARDQTGPAADEPPDRRAPTHRARPIRVGSITPAKSSSRAPGGMWPPATSQT